MTLVKQATEKYSGRLAHRMSGDIRQVVIFVVRLMVSPHHENNFEPLCSERSECLMFTMAFGPLISVNTCSPIHIASES